MTVDASPFLHYAKDLLSCHQRRRSRRSRRPSARRQQQQQQVHVEVKAVLVGAGHCGKSSLAKAHANGKVDDDYDPTVLETHR